MVLTSLVLGTVINFDSVDSMIGFVQAMIPLFAVVTFTQTKSDDVDHSNVNLYLMFNTFAISLVFAFVKCEWAFDTRWR